MLDMAIVSTLRHLYCSNPDGLCRIVPYLLTAWALECDPNLLVDTSQVVRDQYSKRIATLKDRGLTKHVNSAWDSVPYEARKLMIHMWATRPATRLDFAHPIPTVTEAQDLVQSDPLLTPVGRNIASTLIPIAVNNKGDPLFFPSV
jgi:hypothetical protein